MDCTAASERLPWLVGGGLPPAEADEVRRHLAACPRCQGEMEETRHAADVFGAHLPVDAIVDLAWTGRAAAFPDDLVRAHLGLCAECAEELDLARAGRALEASGALHPEASRPKTSWRGLGLPATLAAGLVVGGWLGRATRPDPPSAGDSARVARLEAEVARLTAREGSASRPAGPRLNVPVFEVLPEGAVRAGADGEAASIAVPAHATEVALFLVHEEPGGGTAGLAIRDGGGREVWRGDGLVSVPPGGYVVVVPAGWLRPGTYALHLRTARGAARSYRVRVEGPGAAPVTREPR